MTTTTDKHYEEVSWEDSNGHGVQCGCGEEFGDHETAEDAAHELRQHIASATTTEPAEGDRVVLCPELDCDYDSYTLAEMDDHVRTKHAEPTNWKPFPGCGTAPGLCTVDHHQHRDPVPGSRCPWWCSDQTPNCRHNAAKHVRMGDTCGREHTYREFCQYAEETK